mgnify:CR=1 FL=1
MMQLRPGQITALVGGVLILISTFLDWFGIGPFGVNAYDGDFFGFTGILLLLLSLDIIATTAIRAFAPQVNLPQQILGFSLDELTLAAGFAAFIWGLSISTVDGSKGGTLLAALGGLAVVIGAFLELRSGGTTADEPRRTI